MDAALSDGTPLGQDWALQDPQDYLAVLDTVIPAVLRESGVAAEVIGLPDGSIGDALYRAKITLSTGELFAWTFVIIVLSAAFEKLFLALLDKAVARVLGEEAV